LRGLVLTPDRRRRRAQRPRADPLPARELRAGVGQRNAPALPRLFASLRPPAAPPPSAPSGKETQGRAPQDAPAPAQAPVRRALLALLLVVVLGVGLAGGYALWLQRQARDVRGSPTVEFVPTTRPLTRVKATKLGIAWPTYGFDNAHTRAVRADE